MIVKCDQCQTRFKIPDEKVTEKGVKVRCTKCQHTFRVKKAPTEAATVPSVPVVAPPPDADAGPDPFAQFAAPFEGQTRKMTSPTFEAQSHLPSELFDQPTRVGPLPTAPPEPRRRATPAPTSSAPTALDAAAFNFEPPPPLPSMQGSSLPPPPKPPKTPAPPAMFEAPPPPVVLSHGPADGAASLLGDVPFLGDDASPPPAADEEGQRSGTAWRGTADAPPAADDDAQRSSTAWRGSSAGDFIMPGPETINLPSEPDRAQFDMPAKPVRESEPPPTTLGRIKLVSREEIPIPSAAVSQPSAPDAAPMPQTPLPTRSGGVLGLIHNVAFSVVLFLALLTVGGVYLNEGKLELSSFSLERLKTLVFENPEVVTLDISNGLYDTRAGRPVFYVRGEVENRGAASRRVKVRAEILDGDRLVRAAEGWAGAMPSPEELFAVTSKEELQALSGELEKKAVEVAKGSRAPFAVAFHEYPPALSGLRLKVTVVEQSATTAAAR